METSKIILFAKSVCKETDSTAIQQSDGEASVFNRVKEGAPYTKISNDIARDESLSMGAKGLLLTIFSNNDGWAVNQRYLVGSSKRDGRYKIRGYMREIEAAGYACFATKRRSGTSEYYSFWEFFSHAVAVEHRTNRTNRKGGLCATL